MFLGGCPCCGKKECWRCYTDGTDYECVGPNAKPKDGWSPVGDCHPDEESCAEECGPCWRCYGKSQGECCETIMQRSGYKFCDWLTENSPVVGDLYPNARVSTDGDSFSGLFFRSVDPGVIQLSSTPPADNQPKVFVRGSVDSEQNNECEFATMLVSCTHDLETSGPISEQREQTNAYINTRTVGALLDFPAILLGTGSASSSSNVKGRITSASLGSISVTVPNDKSSVVFYPSYGTVPPVTDPTQLFVPVDSYEGTISYDWFFVNNKTGTSYSGSVSIEWDELICKDFCVSQEDPDAIVEYQCFDAPPTEDGWSPVGDCHKTEEECAKECGPNLCCIPPITINGPYQCKNTTKSECDSLGGSYYKGYRSDFCNEGSITVDPICGSGFLCQDQSLCYEVLGGPASCVEYTVTIESIEKELTECALSFMLGTGFGNGYPLSEGLSPPCGQKIPGFTPTFRWVTNSVTVRDGEIGYLIAEIDIDGLNSLNSHQNILFPDNPAPPTPGSPAYSGGMSCKIVQEFPFFVVGCTASEAAISIGSPLPPRCELPSSVYQLEGIRGASLSVSPSNEFAAGVSELSATEQLRLPKCGCDESCSSAAFDVNYTFRSSEIGYETVKWWPTNSPRPQENSYLGTSWIVESNQEWNILLTQKTIECESDKKAVTSGGRTITKTTGPGTHLKNMLAAWGIHAKKGGGCKCKDMEVKMNRWGSDCRQHMDAIVDHLQAEAKKRNLPFVRRAGEMLVKRAIKRFEKES